MSTAGVVSRLHKPNISLFTPLHCCFRGKVERFGDVFLFSPLAQPHPSLLDCHILPHDANFVFCQSTLHLAHMVPALSLGTVMSLPNFWTSKHRLILHRHPSKHVRKASPTFAWAFNTVRHIFQHCVVYVLLSV